MSNGGNDIFISYSSKDREWVANLAKALSACGFDVWWDQNLLPGDNFQRAIPDALVNSHYVITVFSEDSVQSDWVLAETSYAHKNKVLIPVTFTNVVVPVPFNNLHEAALVGWEGDVGDPRFLRLLRSVRDKSTQPISKSASIPLIKPSYLFNNPVANKKDRKGCSIGVTIMLSVFLIPILLFNGTGEIGDHSIRKPDDLWLLQLPDSLGMIDDGKDWGNIELPNNLTLIQIPAGYFQMGSDSDDIHENPIHRIEVEKHWLSEMVVTFDQYDAYLKATGGKISEDSKLGQGTDPVTNVSWYDAQNFVKWLGQSTGLDCSLPSESEWEFAARLLPEKLGLDSMHGNVWEWTQSSSSGDSHDRLRGSEWDSAAKLLPKEPGLDDMSGNVWEWSQFNPPSTINDDNVHILRGGSWSSSQKGRALTFREKLKPYLHSDEIGFRVACK